MRWIRWFVIDYLSRHRNPRNRFLHLIGVPLAPFLFLYLLFRGEFPAAGAAFVAGYSLQWLGHRIEGNEVGEWTLLKSIWRRLTLRRRNGEAEGKR
jgi:hypothetical protein